MSNESAMRVAIFYNLAFGGAKRVVMEHAKGLRDRGHTVDLYVTNLEHDAFDPSPYCDNVHTYSLPQESKFPGLRRLVNDYRSTLILKKLHRKIAHDIDSSKYDIVLAHPDRLTQSPFILRFLKTPSVYYCQEPFRIAYEYAFRLKIKVNRGKRFYEEFIRQVRKQIDRTNVRSATMTIASCYHVRERMIEAYDVYPKVVYCAVDEKTFHPIKVKKKNQLFYVGSPNLWTDGYDLAKNALKYIPSSVRPKLYVVEWKKANGERLTEKELVKIYNESIVTLCTSRLETFGLVPLESMACGIPVIATNVSGHRETVKDKETGFLVDFDPKEIAEKILFFIKHPKKTVEIGKKARRHIEEYWNWNRQIDALEKVLRSTAK